MGSHLESSGQPSWISSSLLLVSLCSMVAFLPSVTCYGSGAPTKVCASMQPGHYGGGKQNSASPYTIDVSGHDHYTPGIPVELRITGRFYKGILIQARKTDGSTTPVGSFSESPTNTKMIQCTNDKDSVTHSNDNKKMEDASQKFQWDPPSGSVGNIKFVATIAEEKLKYWMNVESDELPYSAVPTTPKRTSTPAATTPHGTSQPGTGSSTPSPSSSPAPASSSSTARTTTTGSSTSTTPSSSVETTKEGSTSIASRVVFDLQCLVVMGLLWYMQHVIRIA